MNLATELQSLRPEARPSPLAGFEHVRGYGVFGMPFSSGHVLALRVFPQNDFAPYTSLWHRTPEGAWSIYVHGAPPELACPRYFGPATQHSQAARIDLKWTGPMELKVEMDSPRLSWDIALTEPPLLRLMNAVSARIPEAIWRFRLMSRLMEWMAQAVLRIGRPTMAGRMPNGQLGILMPQRMYFVRATRAVLNGLDLGEPVTVGQSPQIGEVRLPARPTFAIGRGYFQKPGPG